MKFSENTIIFFRFVFVVFTVLSMLPFVVSEMSKVNTPYYVVPMIVVGAVFGFLSIPFMTSYLDGKSVTMRDLIDHTQVEEDKKNHYKQVYMYSIFVLSAILVGILTYYFAFEVEVSALTWIEVAGMMRGLISYYFDIQHTISKIIKKVLHIHKQQIIRQRSSGRVEVTERVVIDNKKDSVPKSINFTLPQSELLSENRPLRPPSPLVLNHHQIDTSHIQINL